MQFYSNRSHLYKISFKEALFKNLAPDGGLYLPTLIPRFTENEIKSMQNNSLQNVAHFVLRKFIDDISEQDLWKIIKKSFTFPIPIKKIGKNFYLELFHGYTMAFKDVGVGTLARLMEHVLAKDNKKILILTATSGDTGAAVAQAFSEVKGVKAIVLFPENQISHLQEEQMTRVAGNIYPVAVKGTFDDCQKFIKTIFHNNKKRFGNYELVSANSINIGRLLPQVVYYVYASLKFQKTRLRFVVPSGNMGNITAGIIAKKMGAPIDSFIIACNANDPVVIYFKTGKYGPKNSVRTLSNAMDIGNPNNFERVLDLYDNNHHLFKQDITAISISDDETIATMKKIYKDYDYIIDPHTAVAVRAGERLISDSMQDVILATASPKKFALEIKEAAGIEISEKITENNFKKYKKRLYRSRNSTKELLSILESIVQQK
ncbi:threonine synthase [Candidatus Roizmanbacteria bacterium RIFCSPLOWO2_01_FULL_38_12]|uniref:Threonine synthase n=1 Tax=Candidatus Roizmanbacteria bacterium RIFCSPLOWO2_01_FULL_38_12 TaxID=1802061 RepID=A0A1F7IV12_9BACT|nr:MAG: threonine synthase [Candidatus Roizmanbacteria bacterium RIFCSPHIGHO2_12_FULL_38_13]OGK47200.1 MAG: threonine synthase [Candidatus Roizmanbacteria bacterium RIFCSPLOWO2_01_FULL_38_12]